MYLDVSDVYPKMYPGLVWDTCKIHAKYQDTCILLECNRAFKIHLGYIRIHERYMYPSGYTQDTSQYIRIRILITNPPKLDNNPPLTRARGGQLYELPARGPIDVSLMYPDSVAGTGGGGRILENPRRRVSPPSDATAVTAPVCPVFRVVVEVGIHTLCVDSTAAPL
jgi:hypothetical protein